MMPRFVQNQPQLALAAAYKIDTVLDIKTASLTAGDLIAQSLCQSPSLGFVELVTTTQGMFQISYQEMSLHVP